MELVSNIALWEIELWLKLLALAVLLMFSMWAFTLFSKLRAKYVRQQELITILFGAAAGLFGFAMSICDPPKIINFWYIDRLCASAVLVGCTSFVIWRWCRKIVAI